MTDDANAAIARRLEDRGWRFYAVTTSDRPERQSRLRDEFGRLAIPVAVHVGDRPTDRNGFASVGTWGCFAGHLACLERARDDGAAVAVIAEDDVVITSAFERHVLSIAAQLEGRSWAMAYLGYLRSASPARRQALKLISANLGRLSGWEVRGSHLYAVHASALDALVADLRARLEPGGHRISSDGVLNEFRRDNRLETIVCVPNLAHQAPSPSGITAASGMVQAVKDRILASRVQPVVELTKRIVWDISSSTPAAVHALLWNGRARLPGSAA